MKRITSGAAIALVLLWAMITTPATAEPSDWEKLQLKSAVTRHIGSHSEDGTYFFVKPETVELLELSFVAMHPIIFQHPNGMFVLCADFKNEQKNKVLIDYYVREIEGSYIVLASVEGKRSLLMRLAERFRL